MNEVFFYFSPFISIGIFVYLARYLKGKTEKVRLTGADYLRFINTERKWYSKFRKLRIKQRFVRFIEIWVAMYEKFLRKMRIEALRMQVWVDKKLEGIKEERDHQEKQSQLEQKAQAQAEQKIFDQMMEPNEMPLYNAVTAISEASKIEAPKKKRGRKKKVEIIAEVMGEGEEKKSDII